MSCGWVGHNPAASGDVERELLHEAGRVGLGWEPLGGESGPNDPGAGDSGGRSSRLLAGLLWRASVSLVDQLLDDVMVLRAEPDGARWSTLVAQSQVLRGLPARFWHRITPVVAAKLLVVAVDLTSRVVRGWAPPSCVADELVLRCLLDEVAVLAETCEVALEPGWREMLEEALFEDLDHELLYDPAVDDFEDDPGFPGPRGMASMGFDVWFVPFNAGRRLPPYAEDRAPTEP